MFDLKSLFNLKGSMELNVLIALQISVSNYLLIKNKFYYNLYNIICFLSRFWIGGTRRKWGIINIKNYLEVADPSSDVYAWGSKYFEVTVSGVTVNGYSASGLLLIPFY